MTIDEVTYLTTSLTYLIDKTIMTPVKKAGVNMRSTIGLFSQFQNLSMFRSLKT